ncbi:MAG TPA: error-prone DNA polymerase [Caulobacteraceae bacterium]|jgi:error-prone DNA polymerase|nr:error-prone DNA polymerase [Caulobacteraceae bacterium]
MSAPYAELAVATAFSFLRGASQPWEMVRAAHGLGHAAVGVADRNTLAGVVRAHAEAQACGIRLVMGARIAFADGSPEVLAYPEDREGYARLSRLLTLGSTREDGKKGDCTLSLDDLIAHSEGLCLAVVGEEAPSVGFAGGPEGASLRRSLDRLVATAPGRVWLAVRMGYGPADARRLDRLADLAAATGARLLATNDVLYHTPERRPLQDVMSCIREHTTLEAAGRRLEANAERHLKSPAEMARLFADYPEAVAETVRLAQRCTFNLQELRYEYPDEPIPPGKTAQKHLEDLAWEGARWRYPAGIPNKVRKALKMEFRFIRKNDYACYFLTVHDVVKFAREQDILCQGRGSAANSVVCFCLGITAANPMQIDLLFARFVSSNRKEPPDIDVDFEHERREEVIQYIYDRYGRDRAAICATVIHYRPRSAIREVGKVLGLSEDVTGALAGTVWGSWGDGLPAEHIRQAGLDPENPVIEAAVALANELIGFPRHLSQHVGGFILTQRRLDETVPIANGAMKDRTFIEWDKDDIDTLGIMKVDVLALGMLTCIRKAIDLLRRHGVCDIADIADIKDGDRDVYAMLQRADTVGVFQIESRAQMNMLPRLKPEKFYDLVIEVAIVRPGPIQGDMVHPYLRRKQKLEEVEYASPAPEHGHRDELRNVLEKTLGVPLFQEQAMQVAITAARFTPAEADGLRRAMATFKSAGGMDKFRDKMVGGMIARGYPPDFAERCFKQIEGFGSYGFPESHAASFAILVWVSAWLKHHHPAAFACALLNSQPMGFYAPAQIVRDAREHGVEVRPVDVEHSDYDCTLEPGDRGLALRLGLRQVGGVAEAWADQLVAARGTGFGDFETLVRRSGLTRAQLQRLAEADAFRSLGLGRREALWEAQAVAKAAPAPLIAEAPGEETGLVLPSMALSEHVVADYQTTRLSLKGHPMGFLREAFAAEGIATCARAGALTDGDPVACAGVVLVRQRPGKGVVCFITIEDETGVTNLVVLPKVFDKHRKVVMGARLLTAVGRIQKSDGVVHILVHKLVDRTAELRRLAEPELPLLTLQGAEIKAPHAGHPRNVRIMPGSRDFH